MDEPLSNLDAPLRERARAEIRRLHRETGATVVYVTHDQGEALSLGERVAVLDGGRLRQVGAPDEVYEHPADRVVARFIGSPPMNLVPVTVAGGVLRGAGAIVLPLPAGCRPRPTATRCSPASAPEGARCPAPRRRGRPSRLFSMSWSGPATSACGSSSRATAPRCAPAARRDGDAGETVGVAVDVAAVRLFDAATGLAR